MPTAVHLILLALLIIGASMWIGGMIAVTMLSIVSKKVLEPAARTALFRGFGKTYFPVFGAALVVAGAAGLVMLVDRGWDGIAWAIVILVVIILIALGFGVVQARTMGRLRARAATLREEAGQSKHDGVPISTDTAEAADSELAGLERSIASGARWAALLRGSLGALSAAVFVLAICTAA